MLCVFFHVHIRAWKELPGKINFKIIQLCYYQRCCVYDYHWLAKTKRGAILYLLGG